MNSFEEQGYLSNEACVFEQQFEQEFAAWVVHTREVNGLAMEMLIEAKRDGATEEKILANQLLVRIVSNFQAVMLTAQKGLAAEMRTLMRSMLEAVFVLQATEKSPGFADSHTRHSFNQHRKYIQRMADLAVDGVDVSADLDELAQFTRHDDVSALEIAKLAGMEPFYVEYARLCMHTHPSGVGLSDHLKVNEHGQRTGTVFGPLWIDMAQDLLKVTSTLLMALGSVDRMFNLNHQPDLLRLLHAGAELDRSSRANDAGAES